MILQKERANLIVLSFLFVLEIMVDVILK